MSERDVAKETGAREGPVFGTGADLDVEVDREQEIFTVNLGPHHPATHGVLRLLCSLEGEYIREMKPIIGYVHTGIEKSCEDQSYWKVITFVERMDYLAYYFNAMAYCMAVEKLIGLEVPPRAQYLRVIHLELNRIASHLFWLATSALDLGAVTFLWWGIRERDLVVDLYPSADFQEREIYDMFGVLFEGHPDMRRILMPEDYEGYPQRRDFPMGGEPVLFTFNEHKLPRWYE